MRSFKFHWEMSRNNTNDPEENGTRRLFNYDYHTVFRIM